MFLQFVDIVDNLLGNTLPEREVTKFSRTPGFKIYQTVASDPANADDELRSEFFAVVDKILGGLNDDVIGEFGRSPDFDTYKAIGALYN